MAFSSSIKQAQAVKLCELCQEGIIKWRCIDCDKCMCEKCKTIHTKVPVTAKHEIVTIATPLKDLPRKIVIDNIPCKEHSNSMTCIFCQTCDFLVCTECVSANHSRHQFVPLETSVERKLDKLRGVKAHIIDELKYCESKYHKIQNIKSNYQIIFEESIEKIQQKEKELKDAISKYSTKLQKSVKIGRSNAEDAILKVEQQIDQVRNGLIKQMDEIENAMKSTKGAVIFETDSAIKTLDIAFNALPGEVGHFLPKAEKKSQIQELFGSFQKVEVAMVKEQNNFQVLETINTDLSRVNKLIAKSEMCAWISDLSKKVIKKIHIIGKTITTSQEVSSKIADMDLTAKNNIIFSDYKSSDIKLITNTGDILPLLSVAPLIPKGIHVTKDNKIIIGVREDGNSYKVPKKGQRAVAVFYMNGKQEQMFQYDENGKRLFTLPLRIVTNTNQDMIILDSTSETTGRLVFLNRFGKVKNVYEGHPEINASREFDPSDLTVTSVGHIIVSDFSNHALHVLSGNGICLVCKSTEDLGISYPYAIDIDRDGQIWISCDTGGQLHIVKFLR